MFIHFLNAIYNSVLCRVDFTFIDTIVSVYSKPKSFLDDESLDMHDIRNTEREITVGVIVSSFMEGRQLE